MLAYTTIAIAADRYGQNANKQILEDSVEKKQQNTTPRQPEPKQPTPVPQVDLQQSRASEVQSLHKSLAMGYQDVAYQTII